MLVVGAVLVVGLVGAAVALWTAGGQRRADNVAGFARALAGCDTTLDFDSTGTFVLYVETTGAVDALAGECDAELRYDRDSDDIPRLDVTLRDPRGDELDLADTDGVTYDVDGFVGSSALTVRIDTPGDHVVTVAATDGEPFAIAVGRSPDTGVALLRWLAVTAAIVGLVLGGLFLVLGSRRPPARVTPPPPWTPDDRGWPASPPGFPSPPPTTGASSPPGPPLVVGPQRPTAPPSKVPPSTVPPSTGPAAPEPARPSPWAPPSAPQ
jgi:hypothetical protein